MFRTCRCPARSIRLSLICKLLRERERNTVVNASTELAGFGFREGKAFFFFLRGRVGWPSPDLPPSSQGGEKWDPGLASCLSGSDLLAGHRNDTDKMGPNGDQTVAPKPEEPCVNPPPPAAELYLWEGRHSRHSPPVAHVVFGCIQVVFFSCPPSSFFYYTDTNSPTICNFTLDRLSLAFSFLPFALFGLFHLQEIVRSGEFKRANSLYLFDLIYPPPPQFYIFYLQTISFLPPCWNFACA